MFIAFVKYIYDCFYSSAVRFCCSGSKRHRSKHAKSLYLMSKVSDAAYVDFFSSSSSFDFSTRDVSSLRLSCVFKKQHSEMQTADSLINMLTRCCPDPRLILNEKTAMEFNQWSVLTETVVLSLSTTLSSSDSQSASYKLTV